VYVCDMHRTGCFCDGKRLRSMWCPGHEKFGCGDSDADEVHRGHLLLPAVQQSAKARLEVPARFVASRRQLTLTLAV